MSKKFSHQKILLNFIAGCVLTLIPAPNIFAGDSVTKNSASSSQTSQTLPIQSDHNNSDVPVLNEQTPAFFENPVLLLNRPLPAFLEKPEKSVQLLGPLPDFPKNLVPLSNGQPLDFLEKPVLHLNEQIPDFPEKSFLPKNQCLKTEGFYCQKAVRKICEKFGTTWEKQNIYRIVKPVLAAMGEKPPSRSEQRCISLFYNRAARYDDDFIKLFSMCCCRITLAEAMRRPVPTDDELTKELIEILSHPNS